MPGDDVPLRDYIEHIYRELYTEMDRRYMTADKAIDAAALAMKERLDGMNEFRSAIGDTVSRTVTRDSFDAQVRESEARATRMEIRLERIEVVSQEEVTQRALAQGKLSTRLVALGIAVSAFMVIMQVIIGLLLAHHVL